MLAGHLSRYKLACSFGIVAVALFFALKKAQSGFWERTLRGPYSGISITNVAEVREDSVLRLDDDHVLAVSNSYAREGENEWPLVVLRHADGTVKWARLMKPSVTEPGSGATDYAFVRDVRLLKRRVAGPTIKAIFSCDWGYGGHENGIIYIDGGSLDFQQFAISW